jgi:hypothetical protein
MFIRPLFEYSDVIWVNITSQKEYEIEKIQLKSCRIITGVNRLVSVSNLYTLSELRPFKIKRRNHRSTLLWDENNITPSYLSNLFPVYVGDIYYIPV